MDNKVIMLNIINNTPYFVKKQNINIKIQRATIGVYLCEGDYFCKNFVVCEIFINFVIVNLSRIFAIFGASNRKNMCNTIEN